MYELIRYFPPDHVFSTTPFSLLFVLHDTKPPSVATTIGPPLPTMKLIFICLLRSSCKLRVIIPFCVLLFQSLSFLSPLINHCLLSLLNYSICIPCLVRSAPVFLFFAHEFRASYFCFPAIFALTRFGQSPVD